MKGNVFIVLFILCLHLTLRGLPPQEHLLLQEMRLSLENVGYQIHSQHSELEILHEKSQKFEQDIKKLKENLSIHSIDHKMDKRLIQLEQAHESVFLDLKNFKKHINEINLSLALCQKKIDYIDKHIVEDIKNLKSSIQTVLTVLQAPHKVLETHYIVKTGDTLGKIAIDHHTDSKSIRQLNQLSGDTIFPGQKLLIPDQLTSH